MGYFHLLWVSNLQMFSRYWGQFPYVLLFCECYEDSGKDIGCIDYGSPGGNQPSYKSPRAFLLTQVYLVMYFFYEFY